MPATNDELIRRAIDMVGPDDPEDYRLVPTAHPAALQDRAPVLATLLRSDELQALARRYEADDQRAIESYREFRRAAGQLNAAVLLTAVLGALMLAIGVWSPQTSGKSRSDATSQRPPVRARNRVARRRRLRRDAAAPAERG